jgi:ubiquinone/menaquinone biosynthesis C-methylase UbiE
MPFEDASFEFIACKAILEHIPYPEQAISEFWRLLKPGGEVWIEVPMNQPYHPIPQDYWRVTPEGMRIWMQKFEERSLGLFYLTIISLITLFSIMASSRCK